MPNINLSTNKDVALAVREKLAELANVSESNESAERSLRTHDKTFYLRPESRTTREAAELYTQAAADEEEVEESVKIFEYRPWDGAYAFQKTLKDLYGHAGFGVKQKDPFFGTEYPPRKISVNVSVTETVEVPWGEVRFPWGEGEHITFILNGTNDAEKGMLFVLSVTHKKKHAASVKGLLIAIEETLRTESLYRGKAFTGAVAPDFIDLTRVSDEDIFFAHTVQEALERELWASIERRELFRAAGRPTRWNCLFVGDYGTGKTLATILTAQKCVENGITFIQARPGKDDLMQVMSMANLYAPAVVAFEDVDQIADREKVDASDISMLLEAFDGMRSKSSDVSVILTTNFPEKIDPGLIRAGRIQGLYEFGPLDEHALARLISAKIGEHRLVDLDSHRVYTACNGYSPAFMDLVIEVSRSYALSKHADELDVDDPTYTQEDYLNYRISTDDLVAAADRLRPQYDRQEAAKVTHESPVLEDALRNLIQAAVNGTGVVDASDPSYEAFKLKAAVNS